MTHDAQLATVTHGSSGFVLAYLLVVVPMIVGMIRARGRSSALFLSPVLAVPLTVVAGILLALAGPLTRALGVDPDGWLQALLGASASAALGYAGGQLWARRPASVGPYRRGAVVSSGEAAGREGGRVLREGGRRTGKERPCLTLAGQPVSPEDETKHFKFVGTTGTGKSTAIRELLSAALARGDRAIIADPDGGYLKHFYDAGRGDVILNPFDPDSVRWNLLSEITNDYDIDQLARSLIPDGRSDGVWTGYARTFFGAVVRQARRRNKVDDGAIFRLFTRAPTEVLRDLLQDTAAGPFLEPANDRMFGSIRSVTSSAVAALEYTTSHDGAPFSVRQWVRGGAARQAGGRGGVLFMPYKAGEIAALRTMVSAWMRIAIFEAMNRDERDHHLWFAIDELDALGEIDGLKDALARVRKFGGRCILGFQSISQVSGTYGNAAADAMVENCGNALILRCSASEHGGTSLFASRLIGDREVMHASRSYSRRPGQWLSSITTSEHRVIESAVLPSEIERLPDLEGFLKIASTPDWRRVRLTPVSYPTVERPCRPERVAP